MVDVHCPSCGHKWEDVDLFDETDIETETDKFRDRLVIKEDLLGRMREELKGIVDEWDQDPFHALVIRVYDRPDIQRIRRLVEE